MKANNLVAKHAGKFNRAVTMRNRKTDYSRKGKGRFNKNNARLV